jgi:hypothetical protein
MGIRGLRLVSWRCVASDRGRKLQGGSFEIQVVIAEEDLWCVCVGSSDASETGKLVGEAAAAARERDWVDLGVILAVAERQSRCGWVTLVSISKGIANAIAWTVALFQPISRATAKTCSLRVVPQLSIVIASALIRRRSSTQTMKKH